MQLQSLVRRPAIGLGLVALLGLAACGSSSAATQATPSSASQAGTGSSPAASGSAVVQTAPATVAGSSTTILTSTDGKTLYYRTSDTATSVCSSGCATTWPPLTLSSGTPSSSASLSGTLAISANANGNQVTYNGHPLYNYSKDAVGETKGEGFGGVWHVATPTLT
jgi:predicted lipoprotein with Yx(FWY)xxD motif